MSASDIAQFVLTGLATGAIYALIGLGIALVYQVTGVINFAQGDFVMVGAVVFAILEETGWPPLQAAAVAFGVTVLVGVATERLALRPARDSSIVRLIVLTIGASITIHGIALVVLGTSPHFAAPFTPGPPIRFAGVYLLRQYLWVFGVTVVTVVLLWLFLNKSMLGKAMRAAAMNSEAARLVSIPKSLMSLLAFILAAALAGVGGIVLAPILMPSATIGITLGLKGFTAAVLGGLDSPQGAVAGGLLLGVAEALVAGLISSGFEDVLAYTLLLVVLLLRPTGLLRRAKVTRV